MKKAIVTGGTGFIGSHLADELKTQGYDVVIIDKVAVGVDGHRASYVLDLKKANQLLLEEIIKSEKPDVIFHLAASKCNVCTQDVYTDFQVNALSTLLLARAAIKAGVMDFIHASTGSIYGPFDAIDEPRPVSYYGVSKLAGEKYLGALKAYHPEFRPKVLRYFHVYGPRQDDSPIGGVVPIFIKARLENGEITVFGDGEQIRHFTHVSDVVKFTIIAKDLELVDFEFDIFHPTGWTINELIHEIERMTPDNAWIIKYAPEKPGDIKNTWADYMMKNNIIMRQETDAYQVGFHDGLARLIDAYKKA